MEKIRKGDEVVVLTGKDRKKRGVVLARVSEDRVLVEGVNVVSKAVKPNPMLNQPGGIIQKSMPIHISNVAIIDPETKQRAKVSFERREVEVKVPTADGKFETVKKMKNVRVLRPAGKSAGSKQA